MPLKLNPATCKLDMVLGPGTGTATVEFDTDVSGPVNPTGAGVVTVSGTSVFSDGTVANTLNLNVQASENTFLIGAGAGVTATELGPLTNGQLIIGSTGVDPVLASLTAPAAGITITGGAGSVTFALADDLAALEGLSGTGVVTRTAANTYAERTITGTAGEIDVADGDGVSGNPTISVGDAVALTVGTDSGTVTPASNTFSVVGTNGISTSGSGSTLTIGSKVVQIVSNLNIAGSATSSLTLVDVTSASLSITPTSSSNKVLVMFSYDAQHGNISATNVDYYASVIRDSTDISGTDVIRISSYSGGGNDAIRVWLNYTTIDSPATTSSVTYKLQHRGTDASTTYSSLNINIILMEVEA